MKATIVILLVVAGLAGVAAQGKPAFEVTSVKRYISTAGAAVPIMATCASISSLAGSITGLMGTPVIDRTGLTGQWTYDLTYRGSEELTGEAPTEN